MNYIANYKIVNKDEVLEYLNRGWELYGSPFAVEGKVYQCVIRKDIDRTFI